MPRPSSAKAGALWFAVLLCGVLLAACGSAPAAAPATAPAAAPTSIPPTVSPPTAEDRPVVPTPTGLPAAPATDDLQDVQSEGVLRVATTLDNPPFSTYDENLKPTGIDIELITDLARRLGLRVEIDDFTFDKLGNALATDLADVAIAAISITPERASEVDFTNVYYVGQDAVLAGLDSDIAKVASLDDLAALRVGAQEGSVYESWLRENAVATGKMPAERLVALVSPDSGIDALEAGEIDVMLLDRQPARVLAEQGKAKLVGEAIYPQVYGIAVRKGSDLLPELNRVLAEAQTDGTIERLMVKYLQVAPEEVLPATPTAAPTP